jgi:hypothetical protein
MGGKRGVCWPFLLTIVMAVMAFTGCICGPLSPAPHDIGGGYTNVSSPDLESPGIQNSTGPLAQDMPDATGTPTPAPTPRPSAFTVYVDGGKDHRPGETLRLYGMDTYSDTVYLFVSGTNAPIGGGCLDDVQKPVTDRDAVTFTRADVSEDGSWEYFWTAPGSQPALMFDLYNVIASAEPRDRPHLDEARAWDLVSVKIS